MGRSLGIPSLLAAIVIGIVMVSTQAFTTREPFTVSYSAIEIQHGTEGPVFITHYEYGNHRYELCSTGYSSQTGETLCQSKGYSYNTYTTMRPSNYYNTVEMVCQGSGSYMNLGNCDIQPIRYCPWRIYLYCFETSSMSPYYTEEMTTQISQSFTVGYSSVEFEYGNYGRVYINHYDYGYNRYEVCAYSYSSRVGVALCRSKGYEYRYYTTSSARNSYNTVDMNCYGTYLQDCYVQKRGYCSSVVYIYCYDTSSTPPYTTEEMTTQTSRPFTVSYSSVDIEYGNHGRVYINHYDYGYNRYEVCSYSYSSRDGEALCGSKGYQYNSYSTSSARNSYNTVDMNCYGNYLQYCDVRKRAYCSSVVYLYCNEQTTVESTVESTTMEYLYPGSSNITIQYGTNGRVFIGQGRYEICSDAFSYRVGKALCGSQGYSYSSYYNGYSPYDRYRTMEVQCYSSDIYSCTFRLRGYCSNSLYLYCSEVTTDTYETTTYPISTETYTSVRLVGGGYHDRGTIQVYHNGQWGTICDDSFDKNDGDVICRMLGFNFSRAVYGGAHWGQGSDPIWLDDLNCYGFEADVSECGSRGWGSHNCNHGEDAGVYCVNDTVDNETTTYEPCYSSACYNGGTCLQTYIGYPLFTYNVTCLCTYGYSGSQCQYYATTTRSDPCQSYPCHNGGTCYTNYAYYRNYYCSCPYRYSGQNCDYYSPETTTYDPCYTNPCRHGGTCYSNYGYPGYYCTCPGGYSGRDCENSTGFSPDGVITVGCNDNQWNLAVYLPPLYSRYPDFNPNDLYLGQDSCSGSVEGNYLHFRSDYTTCGTTTTTSTNNIAYTNEIVYALHDPNHHFIVREYRFRVPVDCYTPRNEGGSGHIYHGHDITLPPSHHVTGSSHHTVHLQFYTDSTFQHLKSLYGSKIGDTIYVKAFTDVRDYNLKMRLSDCFTTPTPEKNTSMKYFIIKNGCVIDPNARIISQSTHETRFYFQDFEFSTNPNSLYLHCNATFCKSNDYSADCEQSCHHKRLGGGNIVFDGPTDAVAVNEAVRLTNAKTGTGNRNQTGSSPLLLVISLVFGVVILAMVSFVIAGKIKRWKQRAQEEVKTI
ncbi:uncharacterized protein LOC111136198 [Crassostrea virginica]